MSKVNGRRTNGVLSASLLVHLTQSLQNRGGAVETGAANLNLRTPSINARDKITLIRYNNNKNKIEPARWDLYFATLFRLDVKSLVGRQQLTLVVLAHNRDEQLDLPARDSSDAVISR